MLERAPRYGSGKKVIFSEPAVSESTRSSVTEGVTSTGSGQTEGPPSTGDRASGDVSGDSNPITVQLTANLTNSRE